MNPAPDFAPLYGVSLGRITLRHLFAGLAMAGMLADGIAHESIPGRAWELADRMLREESREGAP